MALVSEPYPDMCIDAFGWVKLSRSTRNQASRRVNFTQALPEVSTWVLLRELG